MRLYRLRVTPNCESRFRSLAWARWVYAAMWTKLAFYCLSIVMLVSDECKIEVFEEDVNGDLY